MTGSSISCNNSSKNVIVAALLSWHKGFPVIMALIIQWASPHISILVPPLCSLLRAICPGLGLVLNTKMSLLCVQPLLSLLLPQLLIPFFALHLSQLLFPTIPLIEPASFTFASFTPACLLFLCAFTLSALICADRGREKRGEAIEHLQLSWKSHCWGLYTATAFIAFHQKKPENTGGKPHLFGHTHIHTPPCTQYMLA